MKKPKLLYISMSRGEKLPGALYFAFSLFLLPSVLVWVNGKLAAPMDGATRNFVRYLIDFLFILIIFHRFLRDSFVAAWRDIWNFVQAVVLGLVAYRACAWVFDLVMSYLLPGFSNINDTAISAMAGSSYLLTLIVVVFLAPLIEEVLYRGLVFRNLWRSSKVAGYLVSMAAFSAVHVLGYIGTESLTTLVLCFVQYLPAGLCLAWTYSKADNIFAPVIVHAVVNAIAIGALR